VGLMQPAAQSTSRDFLGVSTGTLEVLLKYLRRIINARLLTLTTRVEVGNAMTRANLCVDISRDMDSGRGKKLAFPIYFVAGPYNCSTNILR